MQLFLSVQCCQANLRDEDVCKERMIMYDVVSVPQNSNVIGFKSHHVAYSIFLFSVCINFVTFMSFLM